MKKYNVTELSKMNKPQLVVAYLELQEQMFTAPKIEQDTVKTEEQEKKEFLDAVDKMKQQPVVVVPHEPAKVEYPKPQGIIPTQIKQIAWFYTNLYMGEHYFKPIRKPVTYTDASMYISEINAIKDTLPNKPPHDRPLYWLTVMRVCREFADMTDIDIQAFFYDVKARHDENEKRMNR
jgi:hypothetical protein